MRNVAGYARFLAEELMGVKLVVSVVRTTNNFLACYGAGRLDFNLYVGGMTPVPDQVAFRLDLPAFLGTLNVRQRSMAMDLASGMTTTVAVDGMHRARPTTTLRMCCDGGTSKTTSAPVTTAARSVAAWIVSGSAMSAR